MKRQIQKLCTLSLTALLVGCGLLLTSCDDGTYDHTPPEGKGSLIIDNRSGDDSEVYLNGVLVGKADSGDATVFDLEPGVYRLVLAEEDGYRNYRADIDILQNRLTILDVMIDYSSSSLYYVEVDIEEP